MSVIVPDYLNQYFLKKIKSIVGRFILFRKHNFENKWALYDDEEKLIWQWADVYGNNSRQWADEQASNFRRADLSNWSLPTKEELIAFSKAITNHRLQKNFNLSSDEWFYATEGTVNIWTNYGSQNQTGCTATGEKEIARTLCVNRSLLENIGRDAKLEDFLELAINKKCDIYDFQTKELILSHSKMISDLYRDIDYLNCRLPKLDQSQFINPDKGLWEFWNTDIPEKYNIRVRNPVSDIQPCNVAIDFGTSSTVVAIESNGKKELLRIGVQDFYSKAEPKHYENPTVLELVNLKNTLTAWQQHAYRPLVNWDDVRCSHEALHNFRNNEANPKVVGSILAKIKQWALRESTGEQVRITDQANGEEHILAPLTLRQTVKGQPLTVSENDPFDPVELYAWFLGLNINWRGRGIFLNYTMTFPVAYAREVKEKILASFRRGLQRSLPQTLVDQPAFSDFYVEERGTEPAAYAAAAMYQLGIEPTQEGVAYAVFDFGGGTADFDYGRYRLPTQEEEDEGYEQVFEHVGVAGDRFLGGENLLENMAYIVFQDNLDICRSQKIPFTRPLDADKFAASEMFLDRTQAAHTNTIMMMARLRPIWEQGCTENSTGIEKLELLDREGNKVSCEFSVNEEKLLDYLDKRIELGIKNFYVAMHKYFTDKPQTVHVLLAGNSSRSKWVADYFCLFEEDDDEAVTRYGRMHDWVETIFGGQAPEIESYSPLPEDRENPYSPTAKTGVALGLLELCPGSVTKVINTTLTHSNDDAPFQFYVGRIQRRFLKPGLIQGAPYGEYVELGPIRERVFQLVHTQSPRANTGTMPQGDNEMSTQRLNFAGNTDGHKLFAKVIGPATIEICTAASLEEITDGQFDNVRELVLS